MWFPLIYFILLRLLSFMISSGISLESSNFVVFFETNAPQVPAPSTTSESEDWDSWREVSSSSDDDEDKNNSRILLKLLLGHPYNPSYIRNSRTPTPGACYDGTDGTGSNNSDPTPETPTENSFDVGGTDSIDVDPTPEISSFYVDEADSIDVDPTPETSSSYVDGTDSIDVDPTPSSLDVGRANAIDSNSILNSEDSLTSSSSTADPCSSIKMDCSSPKK